MADPVALAINQRIRGRFGALVGLELVSVSETEVVSRVVLRPELCNTFGSVHAGALIALADTTCGAGCINLLPQNATGFRTLELKSNFIAGIGEGALTCVARPRHLGRSTQVWEANIEREIDGRAIAFFGCTQLILYSE